MNRDPRLKPRYDEINQKFLELPEDIQAEIPVARHQGCPLHLPGYDGHRATGTPQPPRTTGRPSQDATSGKKGCMNESTAVTFSDSLGQEERDGKSGLESFLARQIAWSQNTFGPGTRVGGLTKHIAKELEEIRAKPDDLSEWVDVIILALDGYWRNGGTANAIMDDLIAKQRKNFQRTYPMPTSQDEPSEHVR